MMDTDRYEESQGYRLTGCDGKTFHIWAYSDAEAMRHRWANRHGGLAKVEHLTLVDEREGCWDRAIRRTI